MTWDLLAIRDPNATSWKYVLTIGTEEFRRTVTDHEIAADPERIWARVKACWNHADMLLAEAARDRREATSLSLPWVEPEARAKIVQATRVQADALSLLFPSAAGLLRHLTTPPGPTGASYASG
jgi:hypothetical protein